MQIEAGTSLQWKLKRMPRAWNKAHWGGGETCFIYFGAYIYIVNQVYFYFFSSLWCDTIIDSFSCSCSQTMVAGGLETLLPTVSGRYRIGKADWCLMLITMIREQTTLCAKAHARWKFFKSSAFVNVDRLRCAAPISFYTINGKQKCPENSFDKGR